MEREIFTVCNQELEEIRTLYRQNGVSVNDWLIAKMMLEENINRVVIAADIRDRTRCYRQGAMGNYSTAFSVSMRLEPVLNGGENIISAFKIISGGKGFLALQRKRQE